VAADASRASTSDAIQLSHKLHALTLNRLILSAVCRNAAFALPVTTRRAFRTTVPRTADAVTKTPKSTTEKAAAAPRKKTPGKPKKNGSVAKKAKKPAAKQPAPKRPAAKTTATKKLATKKPAAKKPAPKKTVPKKKVPSERQVLLAAKKKQRDELKLLKEQALVEPKAKPDTAFFVYHTERTSPGTPLTQNMKDRSEKYKALTPSEREVRQSTCTHTPPDLLSALKRVDADMGKFTCMN